MKKGHAKLTSRTEHYFNIIFLILSNRDSVPEPIFLGAQHFSILRTSRFEPIYYLMNIVAALPAALRYSPLIAAEHSFLTALGPALIPSHSVCLAIGSCCSEVIFTLSGDQRRVAGRATTIAYESLVRFLSRCSALCEMQAGANFKHTLELTFKQQIVMIFIVITFVRRNF